MTLIKTILISPNESRLRAGWRILSQTILLTVLMVCAFIPFVFFFSQIASFFGISASVFLARKFLDRRSFRSLGLQIEPRAFRDALVGFFIPFFMIGVIALMEYTLGWLTIDGFVWDSDSPGTIAILILKDIFLFILVGWNEELLSRGYHLQNLASGLNVPWAVVISSMVFAGLHIGNPHATWISVVGIFFAGVFLAYAYLRTRQLWLPIGLHVGWNVFEGVVFGYPVSGAETYSLLRVSVGGPMSWTGGPFGPEAGLVVVPALLLGGLLVTFYTKDRQRSKTENYIEQSVDHG
jgi:membrane protease YdiL (CAAX protease family)